ncbi:hypothetical protein MMC27_003871 [Xylographa pallens]|nr:hypothetical protein [Xylographa pallens]
MVQPTRTNLETAVYTTSTAARTYWACDAYKDIGYGPCIAVAWIYNVPLDTVQCKLKYATKDGGLTAETDSTAAILESEDTYPYVPPAASGSSSASASASSSTSSGTSTTGSATTTSAFTYGPSSVVDAPCPSATNGTIYTDAGTAAPGTYNVYCGQNILYDDLTTPANINDFDECLQACDAYVPAGYGPCIGVAWIYNAPLFTVECRLKYATKDGGLTAEADSSAAILTSQGTYPYVG